MNFRNPPSNKYWIPYIYARPNYVILATPLGSKHVPLPLEDFLVAVAITVLSGIVLCCWLCPRRYCCRYCCCSQRCSKKKQRHQKQRRSTTARPVLIITDGGTDVDGTLALCALKGLMQQQQVNLVGVVTSGGQLETRARIARGWLRRLGIADKIVSVAPGSRRKRATRTTAEEEEEEEDPTCYIPKATPLTVQEAKLYGTNKTAAGAKLILTLVRQHAEQLEIIVLGKLTTLAHALRLEGDIGLDACQKGIKMLHLQGQCRTNETEQRLMPDFNAANFKADKQATNAVFASLQDTVPFRVLGKHAAHQISLNQFHFKHWDDLLGTSDIVRGVTHRHTVNSDAVQWYQHMKNIQPAFIHPHGPLCVLAGFQPKLFHAQKMNSFHRAIGNAKESRGVVDPEETTKRLVALINAGLAELHT